MGMTKITKEKCLEVILKISKKIMIIDNKMENFGILLINEGVIRFPGKYEL